MGCDLSKVYNIEIHLENELAVFEPRDEVAGHVLIRAEEDTAIDSCMIWLYGLVKTRWTPDSKNGLVQSGSSSVGLNKVRSTITLNAFGEPKKLDNLCTNTVTFISQITDNLRNMRHEWKKDGLCCRHDGNRCPNNDLDCPWDVRFTSGNQTSSTAPITRSQDPSSTRFTERASSCNSVTDTLMASSERGSCSRHSSSTSKVTCITGDAMQGTKFESSSERGNRFSFLACQSCDACACSACSNRCSTLHEPNHANHKKKKPRTFGDARIIYRAKVNLLKHYNSPIRKNNRVESNSSDSSESSFSKSQDNQAEDIQTENPEKSCGPSAEESTNRNLSSISVITPIAAEVTTQKTAPNTAFLLTRGTHIFDFEFKLPADLPSSFELPTGCLAGGAAARLCYGLRIEIQNYTAHIRHTQQREIIVFRPLELTHFPRLRDRVTLHKEFVLSGCCASPNGLILCDLTVNKTGFVPGESIIPQIHIINRSPRAIQTVHLTFAQTILLRGRLEQHHVEVLRLFATRLKPRQFVGSQENPPGRLTDRSLDENPSLFSPSISPSSHASPAKSDRSKPGAQSDKPATGCNQNKQNEELGRSTVGSAVAVQPHGASAYFEDIIHVPPLPATGLFGRQNLIQVEYMLILRLRMEGDVDGKQEQRMQIPITIGSDPTRETSFIGANEVVPCYASFNYASGEVTEYDPSVLGPPNRIPRHLRPVYRYFKPRTTATPTAAMSVETSHNNFNGNSSSVPSGSKSSVIIRDGLNSPGPSRHSKCSSLRSKQHSPMEAASAVSKSSLRAQVFPPRSSVNDGAEEGKEEEMEEMDEQLDESSDSPSIPILSKQRYFDNGDQITVDEDEQDYELDNRLRSQMQVVNLNFEKRDTPNVQDTPQTRNAPWRGVHSPKRQYSFDIDSDCEMSEVEQETLNTNEVADVEYSSEDDESPRVTHNQYQSDASSSFDAEDVALDSDYSDELQNLYRSEEAQRHTFPSHKVTRIARLPVETYNYLKETRPCGLIVSNVNSLVTKSIHLERNTNRQSTKLIHQAYWNYPKVAPVHGRAVGSDECWKVATTIPNPNQNNTDLCISEQTYHEPVEFALKSSSNASCYPEVAKYHVIKTTQNSLSKRKHSISDNDLLIGRSSGPPEYPNGTHYVYPPNGKHSLTVNYSRSSQDSI